MAFLEKSILWIIVALIVVMLVVDIVTTIRRHLIEMQVQRGFLEHQENIKALAARRPDPFEATGFIAKRMKDDRIMVTFTRPHPELSDRELLVDVILSPENFDYVSKFVRLKDEKENEN